MTSVLSCLVATIALAADPAAKGLPFGLPPAPDDAVISHVAPPECLLYVNWAGTDSPHASSNSETEKLLAEPEVQDFLNALSKVIVVGLRQIDEKAKENASASCPSTGTCDQAPLANAGTTPAYASPATNSIPMANASPVGPEPVHVPLGVPIPAYGSLAPNSLPVTTPSAVGPEPIHVPLGVSTPAYANPVPSPVPMGVSTPAYANPEPNPVPMANLSSIGPEPIHVPLGVSSSVPTIAERANLNIRAEDYGDWVNVLLTHPTAIFVSDVKVAAPKTAKASAGSNDPQNNRQSLDLEIQAGMVVSLGPDAKRLQAKITSYLKEARKAGTDSDVRAVKIAGTTWYRTKPTKPGDKNRVTFGFQGNYLVIGVGRGAVEGILARWDKPAPAWLGRALEQAQVPRRTSITYLNLKALRDKLLPLAPSKKDAVAVLELLGLYNVDSLVSTTGLEDYGMVSRTLLALDGKPRGLLDMAADRPLTAKDLEPIPSNALVAVAARVDLDRIVNALIVAYAQAAVAGDADMRKALEDAKKEIVEKFKGDGGVDFHRFFASLGDTWCVYNSPTEGEIAFLGWTAVVPVRDRATLVDCWEKLCAASGKEQASDKPKAEGTPAQAGDATEVCKCRFAGHEIYYVAGQAIAPAFCISDREMVMTLNMPAMKAYLARKDHRSLATQPGVAVALNERNRPVALGYCDTPRLFDFFYPLVSLYSSAGAAAAHEAKIDLDPTFWPSAPAIRSHLRPEITTVERTPHGLQLTSRYSLPTGSLNLPFWLLSMQAAESKGVDLNSLANLTDVFSGFWPETGSCQAVESTSPPAVQGTCAESASPSAPYVTSPTAVQGTPPVLTAVPCAPAISSYGMAPTAPAGSTPAPCAPSAPSISPYGMAPTAVQGTLAGPTPAPCAKGAPYTPSGYSYTAPAPAVATCAGPSATPVSCPYCPPSSCVATPAPTTTYGGGTCTYAGPAVCPAMPLTTGGYSTPGCAPASAPAAYGLAPSPPLTGYAAPYSQPTSTPYAEPRGVTVLDVVAMSRSGVEEDLIIAQIHKQGLSAALRADNVTFLHQSGVSHNVIATMQAECVAGEKQQATSSNYAPAPYGTPAPTPVPTIEH
jgi:hypothetical protein